MAIQHMGKFTAIGMRTPAKDMQPNALVINTCGKNDTNERGTPDSWVWCNPTNRAINHYYHDLTAVSVECLWQGTKILRDNPTNIPDNVTLMGDWRRGKGRAPRGAYAGPDQPLITSPGQARRAIYLPAFKNLIDYWMQDEQVKQWVNDAFHHDGPVYLRDHDTGRGIDRNGPMSHAWLFCEFLNNQEWPGLAKKETTPVIPRIIWENGTAKVNPAYKE